MCVLALFAGVVATAFHLVYLDRSATQSLVHAWKPEIVSDDVLLPRHGPGSVARYVRATIELHRTSRTVGGLMTSDNDLFVVTVDGHHHIGLRACLWRWDTSRVSAFKHLREWAWDRDIHCVSYLSGEDATMWSLSEFKA
jgi:hypothetical protein